MGTAKPAPMLELEVQAATDSPDLPSHEDFRRWAAAAVTRTEAELLVRIVDVEESAELNVRYRDKQGPTNVLSFPFVVPPGVTSELLGDLVICAPLVRQEAEAQGKATQAHWAHLTVHGVLHLQGYDHQTDAEAAIMEAEEIAILGKLGYPNPYEDSASA